MRSPLAICCRISALGLRRPALDLAEVGVAHPGQLRELAQGDVVQVALLADELPEVTDVDAGHGGPLPLRDPDDDEAIRRC
jgi:hypothetical protein